MNRREFMKSLSATVAAGALGGAVFAKMGDATLTAEEDSIARFLYCTSDQVWAYVSRGAVFVIAHTDDMGETWHDVTAEQAGVGIGNAMWEKMEVTTKIDPQCAPRVSDAMTDKEIFAWMAEIGGLWNN